MELPLMSWLIALMIIIILGVSYLINKDNEK